MRSKFANRSRSGIAGELCTAGATGGTVPGVASELVDRALVGDVDRTAKGVLGLAAGPEDVELVGHVGEDEAADARAGAVLPGLRRGGGGATSPPPPARPGG